MFDVEASPMLRELIMNASRQVGFAGLDIFESLFDLWVHRSPSENDNTLPKQVYDLLFFNRHVDCTLTAADVLL